MFFVLCWEKIDKMKDVCRRLFSQLRPLESTCMQMPVFSIKATRKLMYADACFFN